MNGDLSFGVLGLATALRRVQSEYELEVVTGTRKLPDGHQLTMRWSGDLLELEREDGEVVLLDGGGIVA